MKHLPRIKKVGKYFCKLCRESGILERKAHLIKVHNADKSSMARRSSNAIVDIVFVENVAID